MKSLQLLWQVALKDLGAWCDVCTIRDQKTAADRFEDEGLSFYTITLPGFCDDLQKGLSRGWVDHDLFSGFHFTSGLPRFLGGFLDLIFDRTTGRLLNEPSVDAIFAVRQLTLMLGKVNLPCAPHRNDRAIEKYIECEQEVKQSDTEWSEADRLSFSRIALLAFAPLFDRVERRISLGELRGRHGPGATADKLRGNTKFRQVEWTQRLEVVAPCSDQLIPSYRYHNLLEHVDLLEPGRERPVKVTLVPKTLKTPRIIAIEPTCMQYVQQAVLETFLEEFYRDDILSSLIGFDDQEPNRLMAEQGSIDGTLATLDLSEASDRVSNQHVRLLLAQHPHFAEVVDACRSRKADVPGHGVIRLAKFASMGSALCFPFEAMTFLVMILMAKEKELNRPLRRRDLFSLRGKVRVFGDDLIVPKEIVTFVDSTLKAHGFVVNASKSFWTGKFRESCGKDYWDGHDISVTKVRTVLPTQRRHVTEILSSVSTRNQFYKAGMWRTAKWMDSLLEDILKWYPNVEDSSPVIGRFSYLGYVSEKEDRWLHRPLVKGWVESSKSPLSNLDGEYALLKFFLKRGFEPLERGHLERAGRPNAVNLKLRWATPF